jgi:EmrB/QacA subfamily drug resistance transporter
MTVSTAAARTAQRPPQPGLHRWVPLVTVCLGSFMLLLDVTVVNVALPDMAADLKTSFQSLQWVIDAYAVALAALVLGAGSFADILGHRRCYAAGLALFALASTACGLAPGPGALVAARAVQGVGAAAMFATVFALINANYSGRDRGIAFGMWGAVASASTAIGPIVGGFLTQAVSWRWIFVVNLPVSLVALGLCLVALKDAPGIGRRSVDLPGIAAFTAAAGGLTYGLIRANEHGWSQPGTWGWLGAVPILLAIFLAIEKRAADPMLDLSLLRNRSVVGVLLGGMLLSAAAFAGFTYTSIWLQSILGLSPIQAGLTSLPLSIAAFAVSALLGRFLLESRHGAIIGTGLLLIGAGGILSALLLNGSASWPALLPGFAVSGIGVGLATPTLGSAATSAAPAERAGMAAGALNTARQLGFALGIAALGSVFAARAEQVLASRHVPRAHDLAEALSSGQAPFVFQRVPVAARGALGVQLHAAAASAVEVTFAVAGTVGLLAGGLVLVLVRPHR